MTPTELHKDSHLTKAEAYFIYLDQFDFDEDFRTKKHYEKIMWSELLFAAMSLKDYQAIKNLPDIPVPYAEVTSEHLLSGSLSSEGGGVSLGQTRDQDDSRDSSDALDGSLHA